MGTGVGDTEFQSHIANIRRTGWLPGTGARPLSTTFLYGRFGLPICDIALAYSGARQDLNPRPLWFVGFRPR